MPGGELDLASLREALSGPGSDTRAWVSIGLVDADSANGRSVLFNDEDGSPLPWPTVLVTLQPSGIQVACRVGNPQSGQGEGHWRPFVAGDEVLVCIPQGDEREGCVIVSRLTQGRDAFPPMVAGNDVTTNTTAFDRFTPPYILESGTAIMIRVLPGQAFISLDPTGNITANNSDGHFLALHHDLLSITTEDTSCMFQLNPSAKQAYIQAGPTSFLIDSAGASQFLTTGTLSLLTSGGLYAAGNAITLQQVALLIYNVIAGVLTVATPPLVMLNPLLDTALATAIQIGASAAPVVQSPSAPPTPTGEIPPMTQLAILAALEATIPDLTGLLPGVCRPGLLL